ncbi:MAG: hypothetical protein JNL67_07495 [Planctomycetaceae bacterium]|nr:hypothetical protein [Planctomycetaceae bacterium]
MFESMNSTLSYESATQGSTYPPRQPDDTVIQPGSIKPQTQDAEFLANIIARETGKILKSQTSAGDSNRCLPVVGVDRGSGWGPNSRILLDRLTQTVRRHDPRRAVITYCNERQPDTFGRLATYHQNESQERIYRGLLCGSFLDQLLPSSSVTIVTSNAALHWLDLKHRTMERVAFSQRNVHCLAKIAAIQWRYFMQNIAAELTPGGKLIVSFVGRNSAAAEHVPLQLLQLAIRDVLHEKVGPEQLDFRLAIPIYLRTLPEIRRPFQDRSLSLVLEKCQLAYQPCPYFEQFKRDRDRQRYASEFTQFVRGFSSVALMQWLHGVAPESRAQQLVSDIYQNVQARILSDPQRWTMSKHRVIVIAAKA